MASVNYFKMYINVGGRKVYYEQAGSGTPLLLLHGWSASVEVFRRLFSMLAKNRTVRAVDFPGFGLSEPPPSHWGTAEYSGLVKNLMDEWGCGKTDLLAHSFGARVALKFSHAHPDSVNRLVLTGAAGIRSKKRISGGKRFLQRAAKTASVFGTPGRWVKEKIYRRIGSADYAAAGDMRPVLVRVVNEDLSPILPDIHHETLLIWGENDSETPLEDGRKMKNGLPNSRMEVIKGAGHYAFMDAPDIFYNLVKTFLRLPG
ncbi:MAG: alpha/beta hydrolase [bacterium]|nr:MAG: alpha/beta hydrolase [bacterium]